MKYIITGSFKVIYEDEDKENAMMQVMDNYFEGFKDDCECDDWFKSVEFEFADIEELKE